MPNATNAANPAIPIPTAKTTAATYCLYNVKNARPNTTDAAPLAVKKLYTCPRNGKKSCVKALTKARTYLANVRFGYGQGWGRLPAIRLGQQKGKAAAH